MLNYHCSSIQNKAKGNWALRNYLHEWTITLKHGSEQWLRAELGCNDIEPVVSKWRLACTAWSFRGFHVVWSVLSYVIDIFKDETVKAVTEEQNKAIFSVLSGRDTFVCLQTTVSLWITKSLPQKPVWYHVVKTTRCHGNSCKCATENVSDLGRGLFSFASQHK
jgi:hypothetical protein